jgi:uncharacterized delta-60 repeat protein
MKKSEPLLVGGLLLASFAISVAPAHGGAAGALDTSFGKSGILLTTFQDPYPSSVLFQSNGDIIVVSMFPGAAGAVEAIGIARVLPNGAVDTHFGTSGITYVAFATYYNWPIAAAVQSDDKIVLVSRVDDGQSGGLTNTGIARLTANGSLDTTFGQGGKVMLALTNSTGGAVSTGPSAVLVQSDGKILVAAGAATGGFGATAFVRYNPNGTLDNTFGEDGIQLISVYGGSPPILAELTSGDLLTVAGSTIAQYSPSGALRPQVTGGMRLVTSTALAGLPVLLDPNGNVLIGIEQSAGYGTHESIAQLVRYLPTGGVDWTFQHPTFGEVVDATVEPDDQKIVVVGQAAVSSSFLTDINVLRFNPDGSVDTTFGNGGTVSTAIAGGSASASLVTMQPDNRILVVGTYTPTGGMPVLLLARYLHLAH